MAHKLDDLEKRLESKKEHHVLELSSGDFQEITLVYVYDPTPEKTVGDWLYRNHRLQDSGSAESLLFVWSKQFADGGVVSHNLEQSDDFIIAAIDGVTDGLRIYDARVVDLELFEEASEEGDCDCMVLSDPHDGFTELIDFVELLRDEDG